MASPLLFLLMDTLLFLGLAAACFVLGLWRAKGEDPNEAATSSTGTEMRRRLQLLLLLANVARAVGLAVEIVLFEDGACPSSWTCALVRGGPDLVFLTAYSMLILFWAQLSHTATGSPFPLLRPAFLVSNGLLYLGFLLIVVLSASNAIGPGQFMQAIFHLLGIFYLLATAFLLKYGLRMMRFSQLALPRVLRRRLLLLCSICSAVFLLHALYYLATAAQAALAGAGPRSSSLSGGYPPAWLLPGGSTLLFDALFYPVMELLPSAAILFALHHKRRSYLTDASVVVPYSKISSGGGGVYVGGGMAANGASHATGGGSGGGAGGGLLMATSGGGGGGGGGGGQNGFGACGYGATGVQGPLAGGMGMGGGADGGLGPRGHPSLFGGGGSVVVREGNGGGLMMGMLGGGLWDGPGGVGTTPSTSSGSTRSEV